MVHVDGFKALVKAPMSSLLLVPPPGLVELEITMLLAA